MKPMLAVPSNPTANRRGIQLESLVGSHGFDVKIDGVRCVVEWDGVKARLTNRNGVDVTHRFPELGRVPIRHPVVLDGEVCAVNGSFESTAIRDKQTAPADVAAAMHRMPVQFIAFDVLSLDGNSIIGLPFSSRRELLDTLLPARAGEYMTTTYSLNANLYAAVKRLGMEGVIAKDLRAPYMPGKRSPAWIKFKVTHRVSCVPIGYVPGTGSRTDFGAMLLAMLDPANNGIIPVGRVGTGFREAEIAYLKNRLDQHETFVVEIECLNRTKSGQLRFPVYKGIRTDQTALDATIDQLHALPAC